MEDPSESSIAEVCEFANLDPIGDRNLVIAALKVGDPFRRAASPAFSFLAPAFLDIVCRSFPYGT